MERLQAWGWFGLVVVTVAQNATRSPGPPPPSYLLLAPRVLQPGVPPSVSVTVLDSSPVAVRADISYLQASVASASATVTGGSTKLLTLPPINGSESNDVLVLTLTGDVGETRVFSRVTELQLEPRGHWTFIQTDRRGYLPGQVVRIRAVSVTPDGRPHTSPVDIVITDPRGNLLRQWLAADGDLGVVSREFELSGTPPLGQWAVVATSSGVSREKRFTVAPYELPKFEVRIDAPAAVSSRDELHGSVTARYWYGKPVQGRMSTTFRWHARGVVEVYTQDTQMDGRAAFTLRDAGDPVGIFSCAAEMNDEPFVTVEVNVTEQAAGVTHGTTKTVSVAQRRYKLSFDDHPKTLRPSLNFTATLKLSTYKSPSLSPEDQQKAVHVSVLQQKPSPWKWTWVNESGPAASGPPDPADELQQYWLPVPADGVIPLSILVTNDTEVLIIDASFEDSQNSLEVHRSNISTSGFYLQIQKPSTPVQTGSPLELYVERNFPDAELHYIVKSRGQIVSAGKGSPEVTLGPEVSWSPLASVIVFTVTPSGEVINDMIELPVVQTLSNQVSLSWSGSLKRPGEEVTLSAAVAEQGSLVGVLVVDKATGWVGSNDDITMEKVLRDVGAHSGCTRDPPENTPHSIFESCGLVALTDASLHTELTDPQRPAIRTMAEAYPAATDGPATEPHQEPRERRDFPETWLWMDLQTGCPSKRAEVTATVPGSITTWTASAFVMSEELGLGIVEAPAELTVYQDFFLSLNLPAYVVRGEVLLLEVVLVNYLPRSLEVTVTVNESHAFEFTFSDVDTPAARQIYVESGRQRSVLFPIKPLVLGELLLSVKATSPTASDLVSKTLLVKAEGLEQSFSSSLLLEVSTSQPSISRNVTFTFPADVVEGSGRVSVTAVGDILSTSIRGLDSLIQMPYGCGEQNMINFAPNIYVLQYLIATRQTDPSTTNRATDYMMKGYEGELSYRRADGSFSAFGQYDSSGSTWLTAFVLRCFLQARPFISIDAQVLHKAAAWLAAQQASDGSFVEPGRVIHTELQGGQDGPISLTAYVLIALLEDGNIKARYQGQVSSGLLFLETRLALGVSSNYSLSLLTYALALAGSANAHGALRAATGRADVRDGVPTWSSPAGGLSWSWQPRSSHIETASYVLLSEYILRRVADGLGLMKWLSQQRSHMGGFGSTQDTVVALQALSKFAAVGWSNDDVTLTVTRASTTVASFHIQQDNHLLHQSHELEPDEELHLQVTATGQGFALFQLNVFYNIKNKDPTRRKREAGQGEAFNLYVELYDSDAASAQLVVCSSLAEGLGLSATGMAIMEVGLLSGLGLSQDGIETDDYVKKVETRPGTVIVYLDSVTTTEMCVEIPLVQVYKVAKVQDAAVVIYDYYEPRRRTVRTYDSHWRSDAPTCSFCGERCGDCRDVGERPAAAAAAAAGPHGVLLAALLPPLLISISSFSTKSLL